MNYRYFFKIGIITGFTVIFSSCVKDGEFAQEETAKVLPVVQSELILSSIQATDFILNDTQEENLILSDTTDVYLLPSDLFETRLKKAELLFDLTNSIDRNFNINFEFLNASDEVKYMIKVPVSAGSAEKPVTVGINAAIEGAELKEFKEVTKLVYKISLSEDTTPVPSDTSGSIEVSSLANMFLVN